MGGLPIGERESERGPAGTTTESKQTHNFPAMGRQYCWGSFDIVSVEIHGQLTNSLKPDEIGFPVGVPLR